jgi:hypothetical protein
MAGKLNLTAYIPSRASKEAHMKPHPPVKNFLVGLDSSVVTVLGLPPKDPDDDDEDNEDDEDEGEEEPTVVREPDE